MPDTSIINGNANYFYLQFYHRIDHPGIPCNKIRQPLAHYPRVGCAGANKALAFGAELRQNMNLNDNDSHSVQNGKMPDCASRVILQRKVQENDCLCLQQHLRP